MYTLRNINKTYIKSNKINIIVLNDIDLELPTYGFVSIVGRSGSGKTTLLNILGLLEKPTKGQLFINDRLINYTNKKEVDEIRNEYISFVFQDFNLINDLSVFDNLIIAGEESKIAIQKYLDEFMLNHISDTKVRYLSGGEKQRLAIIRAVIRKTRILLVDEPTGNLDDENTKIIFNFLKKISKEILVIMVSHDLSNVNLFSDYIYNIENKTVSYDKTNSLSWNHCKESTNINSKPIFNFRYIFKYAITLLLMAKVKIAISFFLLTLSLLLVFIQSSIFFSEESKLVYQALVDNREELIPVLSLQINEPTDVEYKIAKGESLFKKLENTKLQQVLPYFVSSVESVYDNDTMANQIYMSTFVLSENFSYNNVLNKTIIGEYPNEIGEILITDFMAMYIFNDEDVIDRMVSVFPSNQYFNQETLNFKVSGIINTNYKSSNILTSYLYNNRFIDANIDDLLTKYAISYISTVSFNEVYNTLPIKIRASNFLLSNEATSIYAAEYNTLLYHRFEDENILYGRSPSQFNEIVVSVSFLEQNGISDYLNILESDFDYKDLNLTDNWILYQEMINLYDISRSVKIVGITDAERSVLVTNELYQKIIDKYYMSMDGFVVLIDKNNLLYSIDELQSINIYIGFEYIVPIYQFTKLKTGSFFIVLFVIEITLILISGMILILQCINNVYSKHKEICIMKSLGIKTRKINGIFIVYNLCITILSSITSVILGVISINIINDLLKSDDVMNLRFNLIPYLPISFIIVFLVSITISLIGTIAPFIKINRMDLGILLKDSI